MRSNIKGRWQPGHQCESFHWSIIYTVAYNILSAGTTKLGMHDICHTMANETTFWHEKTQILHLYRTFF